MELIIISLVAVCIILLIVCVILISKSKQQVILSPKDKKEITDKYSESLGFVTNTVSETQRIANEAVFSSLNTLSENLEKEQKNFAETLSKDQRKLEETLSKREESLEKRVAELSNRIEQRMQDMGQSQERKLESLRSNTETQIRAMREDNNKQLDQMRATVDEKLTKTINERFNQSFQVLSQQLENVYKSIGEMQNMAADVGSLTKVLSNVKTTGIFGEIQLGAILEQILIREQYDVNVVTADKNDPVEYAIKLPGQTTGEFVYLPIDSKFPLTVYTDLYNSYENNDFEMVKQKRDLLRSRIKSMAKDIKKKYVYPPRTTNFAIMFLPIEGLYAEVAKMGLIEELQDNYNVTIAGPTTMSALLNSLQMGFNTLAIQKKSGEVWKILGAVRTEFEKFNAVVNKIKVNFEKTSRDFDSLVGTRSRMIASKLKTVDRIDDEEAKGILGNAEFIEIETDI